MTQWYQAQQRKSDGRWDYCCSNSSGTSIYPLGYCSGWKELADYNEQTKTLIPGLAVEIEKRRPHQQKYHSDGHATAAEADACYRQYQLDNELTLRAGPERPDKLHRCEFPGPLVIGSRWRLKGSPAAPLSIITEINDAGMIWLDTDSYGWTGHTPRGFRRSYISEENGCQQFTAGLAMVGQHDHWHLCDEHRTPKVVEVLFGGGTWVPA